MEIKRNIFRRGTGDAGVVAEDRFGSIATSVDASPKSALPSLIGIGGSLAAPPLPHHRTYGSVYGGSRSYADALRSSVSAGRSGSFTAESDSMSSRPACRASPVGADEKSSLNWIFSRLSLSRFMSYLPLLSFGPSAIVSGSAYLLTPPFGDGVPH